MEKFFREPVNGLTHLIGAVLSLIAFIAMISKAIITGSSFIEYVSICLFGLGMILLYSASATYHSVIANESIIKILKRVDHSMIFVLITGSYAPYCLIALHNSTGYRLFAAVLISSIIGIIFKIAWVTCPRWLSSTIYIAIGWLAIFAIYPLFKSIAFPGVAMLIIGGLFYTVGGVIYALKKDKIKIGVFGSHEIFHLFIMLGTLSHFIGIFNYII